LNILGVPRSSAQYDAQHGAGAVNSWDKRAPTHAMLDSQRIARRISTDAQAENAYLEMVAIQYHASGTFQGSSDEKHWRIR